jgi:hypothetical protein
MKTLFVKCLLVSLVLLLPLICHAEWAVVLKAQGQPIDGLYRSSIRIGEASEAVLQPAPPQAPFFSCSIAVFSDDWQSRLSTSVKAMDDLNTKEWVLTVNPCGNACGYGEASTEIRWDPSQLGEGLFEIREGYQGDGPIVVADMRKTSQFSVTGSNESYYFTIIKR